MNPLVRVVLIACVSANCTFAFADSLFVELDIDGIVGNGPDCDTFHVGELIDVDIWFRGERLLIGGAVRLCYSSNPSGPSLTNFGFQFNVPSSWGTDVQPPSGSCFANQYSATSGFPLFPIALDWKWGTNAYLAIGNSTCIFTVDPPASGWADTLGVSGLFDSVVTAKVVVIGATATESASWSDLKSLFR